MAIGLGASLNTARDVKLARAVTSGLVLKSNFDTGAVTPISDGSVSLSGASDQHVACGTGMPDVTSGTFTISGWYRIESGHDVNTDGKLTFFSRGVGAGTSGYYMKYEKSGANYRFILFQAKSGGYNSISHNVTLSPGTWYHIVWVNGGTGAVSSFYLDGVQVETKTLSQDILTAADVSFKIGISSALLEEWKGNICNVGMWTSTLTSAQIKSIMYKNYSGLTSSEKTNLVSWWNLDEVVDSNNLHVADLANDTLGATALTNGDFSSGDFTGWTAGGPPAGAEVVSHDGHRTAAHITTSSNDHGYNQNVLTAGQVYKVSFDIKVISGSMYLGKDGTQVGGVDYTDSSWTSYTHYWTAPDTYFRIYSEIASSEFYIDNISVQPTNGNYGTLS